MDEAHLPATVVARQTLTFPTPDGPFTIVAGDDAVLAAGWTADVGSLVALIHPGLQQRLADRGRGTSATQVLDQARQAVGAYYQGDLAAPARIAVRQHSGDFRQRAWAALRTIRPGEVVSYTELAARAGNLAAVRAAAGACAANAAALFVPCHRVRRADGSLGGFRYGLAIKRRLLDREAGASPTTTPGDSPAA